jgi:hypothetical protein
MPMILLGLAGQEDLAFKEFSLAIGLLVGMKIVCFVLGYLTVRLGHQLIASGVKGEFKFSASLGGTKADLASVSPGLLFVLLGVLLIGYAMGVEKVVHQQVPGQSAAPPSLTPPSSPFRSDSSPPHDTKP